MAVFSNWLSNPKLYRLGLLSFAVMLLAGCRLREPAVPFPDDISHFRQLAEPAVLQESDWQEVDKYGTAAPPLSLAGPAPPSYWDLELRDAIEIGLANSQVFRDLGGTVLQAPAQMRTIMGPSITETDPRFGVEAALSAFDAQISNIALFQKNDRAVNNELLTGGTRLFQQDLAIFQSEVFKRAATGTSFALRHNVEYDANNAPRNLFGSVWNVNYEAEFRHPLGQGRGVDFNRIAGPQATPGFINGVVIARINTDISLAQFEMGLRDLVNNIENAYWDLYFAYRDLDVRIEARNRALETWRAEAARVDLPGVVAHPEAFAREQYYRFEEDVQNALGGRMAPVAAGTSGLATGLSQAGGGVYVSERRLRLLMGMPANDGRLIRPAHDPVAARVMFDWQEVTAESLSRRTELRAQRSQVKRRELELLAARNFLLPRVDAFGLYRFRGFGHHLINHEPGRPRFADAYTDLMTGDFQEWQLGLEMTMPVGFRQAHSAVRNAQLVLAREKVVLEEQERLIIHDLSNVMAELDRAYAVVQTSLNRRLAATEQLEAMEVRQQRGEAVDLNLMLDAQRRKADADSRYFRSLAELAVAIKNVHFAKGTLMEYNDIYLAEGPWPGSYGARPALHSSGRTRENLPPRPGMPEVIGDEAEELGLPIGAPGSASELPDGQSRPARQPSSLHALPQRLYHERGQADGDRAESPHSDPTPGIIRLPTLLTQ